MPQSPAGFTLSVTCASHPYHVFCVVRIRIACSVSLARRIRVMCSASRACSTYMLYVLCCMFCVARSSHTCVLYHALVAHLCHIFYVACSVSRARRAHVLCIARSSHTYTLYRCCMFVSHAHRAHVFCITRSSRICVLCFMLHVLCRAVVVRVFSVSRARRAHIFCIARSSCICCTLVAYLCCRLCVTRSSRLCNVCYVSCACVPSHTFITLVVEKFSVVHAHIFAHVPGSHDVPIIRTKTGGLETGGLIEQFCSLVLPRLYLTTVFPKTSVWVPGREFLSVVVHFCMKEFLFLGWRREVDV